MFTLLCLGLLVVVMVELGSRPNGRPGVEPADPRVVAQARKELRERHGVEFIDAVPDRIAGA
jgi:hypothetical protein